MRFLKKGLSCVALLAMTAQSYAADLCDPVASAALKTAAIQQELMVAGFTNAGAIPIASSPHTSWSCRSPTPL